ncbi:MAG: FHA domain-containing protein [Myxococcales bacterium]|nr:FHA domain-containing protein [Myxococcales bacterium]
MKGISGCHVDKTFRLPVVRIGRSRATDLPLDDDAVSSRHAEIYVGAGGARLVDCGSTNGTLFQGMRVTELTLRFNEPYQVTMGNVVLEICCGKPARTAVGSSASTLLGMGFTSTDAPVQRPEVAQAPTQAQRRKGQTYAFAPYVGRGSVGGVHPRHGTKPQPAKPGSWVAICAMLCSLPGGCPVEVLDALGKGDTTRGVLAWLAAGLGWGVGTTEDGRVYLHDGTGADGVRHGQTTGALVRHPGDLTQEQIQEYFAAAGPQRTDASAASAVATEPPRPRDETGVTSQVQTAPPRHDKRAADTSSPPRARGLSAPIGERAQSVLAPDPVRARPAVAPQEAMPAWLAAIPAGPRAVFVHIAAHGSINEHEATQLLGGPRQFRAFSRAFDQMCGGVPFAIRVDIAAGIKCYVRGDR